MPLTGSASTSGPRLLLRQLHQVMAERLSTQARLDKIVAMIARNMLAEVCSAYLINSSGELELFATVGLNPDAVHQTRLKKGEGLVGMVADTGMALNLADAPSHPFFAYRPETGEDAYQSFLGVPIQRGGRILGVLVVQNQTHRQYGEDDEDALLTVAVVLAEMIASREIIGSDDKVDEDLPSGTPEKFEGQVLAEGIAIGNVVLEQPRIEASMMIAQDLEAELERLDVGLDNFRDSVDNIWQWADNELVGETRDVIETYRMFANDKGWVARLKDAVLTGLTAEAAVEKVQADMRTRLGRSQDHYLRERLNDLEDLANRLLRSLMGQENDVVSLPDNAIVVAREMGPAELLDYDRSKIRGIILEHGSATSHVTIVAKALEIPMIGRIPGIVDMVEPDDLIILDGESGDVHVRPRSDVIDVYHHKAELRAEQHAQYHELREEPAVTKDGQAVALDINAGLLVDLPHLDEAGAAGIGLFRTELQFMVSATMPRLKVQTEFYSRVLDAAGERPVVFRTVDLGSDKVLPYLEPEDEQNPAMGWRSIRLALDRPGLLRYQIRALLAAAAERDLNLMFPLVAEVSEYEAGRALVDKEVERLRRLGRPVPRRLRVGTMLEVPSLVWQLDALLPKVDFVSVGSNDLLQFLFAWDRSNPRLSGRYDTLSPAVLGVLRDVIEKTRAYDVPLSLCGEMAGKPLEAMALLGLGFRTISMPPASVGPVKMMVRALDLGALEEFMQDLQRRPDHSVRRELEEFAEKYNIPL